MFTEIKNKRRVCLELPIKISPGEYIRTILEEAGFEGINNKSTQRDYLMKGCHDTIVLYVKYETKNNPKILLVTHEGTSKDLTLDWTVPSEFCSNGNEILEAVRELWTKLKAKRLKELKSSVLLFTSLSVIE